MTSKKTASTRRAHSAPRRPGWPRCLRALLAAALTLPVGGCWAPQPAEPLTSPYPSRRLWAVAPLVNESGSLQADGLLMADQLQRQLENASNLDVLPVNRTIQAMESLGLRTIRTPTEAAALMRLLGVDGLLVGTITTWDSYDPPKIGLALELYTSPAVEHFDALQLRRLTVAARPPDSADETGAQPRQPVSIVSAVLDAADPRVRQQLERYCLGRGPQNEKDAWRRYRLSIDRYSEFVAYVMSWRLLEAERRRLYPAAASEATASRTSAAQPAASAAVLPSIQEGILPNISR